jgi:hypothetical protein
MVKSPEKVAWQKKISDSQKRRIALKKIMDTLYNLECFVQENNLYDKAE